MENKTLTIVIPCFNEKNSILTIIDKVKKNSINCPKEIIIVDDYSIDGTKDILKNLNDKNIKIIYHEKNMGKGAALRTGFKHATGDVVIVQDADLEYDPNEYSKIVPLIFNNKYEVVYGSRFLNQKRKGYFANRLANTILTIFSNICTRQHITDMETCYKCFKREVIQKINIEENRFGFEPEITGKVSGLGIKIHEVPIIYNPRTTDEGKKIGLKDGFRALYAIWHYRKCRTKKEFR